MKERKKLTKTIVDALPDADKGKQVDYFDLELRGFGVRVSVTARTYFVMKRVNGKLTRVTLGKHGVTTADEARKQAKIVIGELTKGLDINQEKMKARARGITLQETVELFFAARDLKPRTKAFYKQTIDTHLKDWQKKPLKELTRELVANRHLKISKNSGAVAGNNTMKVLRLMYNFAIAKFPNSLPDNPVKVLSNSRQWNKVERRKSCLREHELPVWNKAVDRIENPTIKDFFKFLLFTGLRKNEALTLQWCDVDFEAQTFTVTDTKNHNPHTLPMTTYTKKLLEERLRFRENNFVFPGTGKSGHLYEPRKQILVIERETAKIINRIDSEEEYRARQEKAPDSLKPGIRFMPHDLRRTFATFAENVVSYSELKRLLNHSTEDDVTQGYLVLTVERLRAPMQKVTDTLIRAIEQRPGKVISLKSMASGEK